MAAQDTFEIMKLSGSTDGRGISVTATSSAGTTIHTGSSTAAHYDTINLYATNIDTSAIKLTIEWGGTTAAGDHIEVTIPPESGLVKIVEGGLIKGNASAALIVKAFAGTTAKIAIYGDVIRASTS